MTNKEDIPVSASVEVGCRIHCDGEHGTVLYIGKVQGMEGTWLGIEWDNPARGKHSGCFKDIQYFKTRVPDAGSFIKVNKADFGISCLEAIKLKYDKNVESNVAPNFISLPQLNRQIKCFELVGMEKIMGRQSNFPGLTELSLPRMLISNAGEPGELDNMLPNIHTMDISLNLMATWTEVAAIVKQMPQLRILLLSKNRLRIPESPTELQNCFSHLQMMVLNSMSYSWTEILQCALMWPDVTGLSVEYNNISVLEIPLCGLFSNLKTLILDNNPIVHWSEVCKLGSLQNLESLHLVNISLESIKFDGVTPTEKTSLFPQLRELFIPNNNLNEWQSITELNKLKELTTLFAKRNPLFNNGNPATARQLVIAKLPFLQILDRLKVDQSERRGAELDYLKMFHSDWMKNRGADGYPNISFLQDHPTYIHLMNKHGAADENEIKSQSVLLKDNLITVHIFSPLMQEKPSVARRLPVEMTVGKLRALVQRLFRVTASNVVLTRVFKENESQRTVLDNNLRQLSFYSVSDQDKIAVEW